MEATVTEELGWEHAIQDIPEAGLQVERSASSEEREDIARILDLVACTSLQAQYALTPRSGGHFRLAGTLKARIEQSCVVTLEPLTSQIAESFSVDFWPETDIPEPIVTGRIKVGRVVFECLAAAIDLFPRKPGVTFEASEAQPENGNAGKTASPFAALARIKNKP